MSGQNNARLLRVALGAALIMGCDKPLPQSPRVQKLVGHYAPQLRVGEAARTALELYPRAPRGAFSPADPPLAAPVDGYELRALFFTADWRSRFGSEVGRDISLERSALLGIAFTSTDSKAARRAIDRISKIFGVPAAEGCAVWPGLGMDRVLHWRDGDRGAAVITIPVITGSRVWTSELQVAAGNLSPDRVEVGFQPGACESPTTSTARGTR